MPLPKLVNRADSVADIEQHHIYGVVVCENDIVSDIKVLLGRRSLVRTKYVPDKGPPEKLNVPMKMAGQWGFPGGYVDRRSEEYRSLFAGQYSGITKHLVLYALEELRREAGIASKVLAHQTPEPILFSFVEGKTIMVTHVAFRPGLDFYNESNPDEPGAFSAARTEVRKAATSEVIKDDELMDLELMTLRDAGTALSTFQPLTEAQIKYYSAACTGKHSHRKPPSKTDRLYNKWHVFGLARLFERFSPNSAKPAEVVFADALEKTE